MKFLTFSVVALFSFFSFNFQSPNYSGLLYGSFVFFRDKRDGKKAFNSTFNFKQLNYLFVKK